MTVDDRRALSVVLKGVGDSRRRHTSEQPMRHPTDPAPTQAWVLRSENVSFTVRAATIRRTSMTYETLLYDVDGAFATVT
jgi:hypothetical protein